MRKIFTIAALYALGLAPVGLGACKSDPESSAAPTTIGAEVPVALKSPAFTGDVEENELLVWQHELRFTGATYISPHFSAFDLPEGARLVVRSPTGTLSRTYVDNGKILPAGEIGFWGAHMTGEVAVLELYSAVSLPEGAVALDRFARGFPPADDKADGLADSVCGLDDSQWAKCYATSEPEIYGKARAVLRLHINGTGGCTGWLVGDEGHVMTNNHCIDSQSTASNTDFEIMAEGATCQTDCSASSHACAGTTLSDSATLVKTNPEFDYAFVKLPTNPTSTYGYLQLRRQGATLGERIYLAGHPAVWGKRLSVMAESAPATITNVNASSCLGSGTNVGYQADTQGGSSGSPVLAYADHAVVALHHCGGCDNTGVAIQGVINDLGNLLPASAFTDASGDVTEPTVAVSSPAPGAVLNGTVTIAATASDNVGVARVEFSIDGAALSSDSAAPYRAQWDTAQASNGNHTIKAVAFDAAGNRASQSVGVSVQNGAAAQRLLVVQVLYDFEGDDTEGEYVTIYNPTSGSISLAGWTLSDNTTTWQFPAATIPSHAFFVIAHDAARFKAIYGRSTDVAGLTLALGNSGDNLTLKNPSGAAIDHVRWENATSGWEIAAPSGSTIERKTLTPDTDTDADWHVVANPTVGSI